MGMDVFGSKPATKAGEYFRNNVWYWRPLWEYVCSITKLTHDQKQGGHWNDGHHYSAAAALRIAKAIRAAHADGSLATYAVTYAAAVASLPDHECEHCHGKGSRPEFTGHPGMEKLSEPGGCNGCNGTGRQPDFDTHYPFTVVNALEFATFCEQSGGFEIH